MNIVLYAVILALQAWQIPAAFEPRFNELAVKNVFHGKPASVVLARPEERRFRTMIRLGAKEGPNFAGHYTVVEWGCGTECFQAAIVDAKMGKIYKPPTGNKDSAYSFESTWLHYRLDSRLLVACMNCRTFADRECEQRYFVWARRSLLPNQSRASTRSPRSHEPRTIDGKATLRRFAVLIVLCCAVAQSASAADRQGLLLGFSIGGGRADCFGCDGRGSAAIDFRIGRSIGPRFAALASIEGMVRGDTQGTFGSYSLTGVGQCWISNRVWAGAGIGFRKSGTVSNWRRNSGNDVVSGWAI